MLHLNISAHGRGPQRPHHNFQRHFRANPQKRQYTLHSGRTLKQHSLGIETRTHVLEILQPDLCPDQGLRVRLNKKIHLTSLVASEPILNGLTTLTQSLESEPLDWRSLITKIREIAFITNLQVGRLSYQEDTFETFKAYLKETKELNNLTISCENMSVRGARELSYGLKKNQMIEELNLSRNGFRTPHIKAIMKSLQRHPSLKSLSLSVNGIGIAAAKHVGVFLMNHHKIENLCLSLNPLGDEGAAVLAEGLRYNTNLKKLNLYQCGITSIGAHILLNYLVAHPSIEEVDLRWNHISEDTCQVLKKWAKGRKIIHLDYNRPL